MYNFSILIPTRHRPVLLEQLLKSIYDSTIDKSSVEIHITHDNDDNSTLQYLETKKDFIPPISTTFHIKERTRNINNDYYNWMALNFATGKYIIAVNDDTLFEMYGWDKMAMDSLNLYEQKHPDGILYGMTEDKEREPKRNDINWMSCFPLISKKAVDVLGHFFDPEMVRDGADWAISATYKNIQRTVDLRNCIIIKHLSTRSGRRGWDSVDEDSRHLDAISPPADSFIQRNSEKLLTYIHQEEMKK
jgi:glycosyltransferase involved in cell wall biosynthesis